MGIHFGIKMLLDIETKKDRTPNFWKFIEL